MTLGQRVLRVKASQGQAERERVRELLRLESGGGDLMFTGLQLAEQLAARGVSMPIVYTSGYPAGLELEGSAEGRTAFVAKPFSGEALTAAVRRQLDTAA